MKFGERSFTESFMSYFDDVEQKQANCDHELTRHVVDGRFVMYSCHLCGLWDFDPRKDAVRPEERIQ